MAWPIRHPELAQFHRLVRNRRGVERNERQAIHGSGPPVIFRDHTICGMWIFNWFQMRKPDEITEMYAELAPLVASGVLISGCRTLQLRSVPRRA